MNLQAPSLPAGMRRLPRGRLGWWLARTDARLRPSRLDAALADGADPWASPSLMARAARLASLEERRWVAAGLLALVEQAEDRRSGSPFLVVRRRCVMNQREALLALAERLSRPAPVHVAAVAQLSVLVSDSYSPAYAGGADPARLSEVTSRCLAIVAD